MGKWRNQKSKWEESLNFMGSNICELEQQLEDAKKRFLDARSEMRTLRCELAPLLCPLNVGDRISISDRNKQYDGIVESIGPASHQGEFLGPILGKKTGWMARGARINKGTGKPGKWSFRLNSFEAVFEDGLWSVNKLQKECLPFDLEGFEQD